MPTAARRVSCSPPAADSRRAARRRGFLVSGAIAAAIVLGAFALRWPHLYRFLAARHWAGRLATAPAAELDGLLEQLAALGPAGLPPLIESLDSPRVELADSARRVLADRIDTWNARLELDAPARLAALATRLEEQSERFGPRGRSHAAELAARMLRGRTATEIDPVSAETESLILDSCAAVLRRGGNAATARGTTSPAPPENRWRQATEGGTNAPALFTLGPNRLAEAIDEAPGGLEANDDPQATPRAAQLGADPARVAHLPGGGLSVPESPWPSHSTDRPPEPDTRSSAAMPGLLPPELTAPAAARPLAAEPQAGSGDGGTDLSGKSATPAKPPRALDNRGGTNSRAGRTNRPSTIEGRVLSTDATTDQSCEIAARDLPADLAALDAATVMRRLHALAAEATGSTGAEAEAELSRRGFTAVQIDLAWRLFHPDVNVRRELPSRLLETPGINPAPWLLQLSQDSDSEVRWKALGLLMTASDPGLAAEAARRAADDGDPRIRRLAERIGPGNRATAAPGP